jgi:hypothetical protein
MPVFLAGGQVRFVDQQAKRDVNSGNTSKGDCPVNEDSGSLLLCLASPSKKT